VTERLSWPDGTPHLCPVCGAPVKFYGSDNGKLVHTLEGIVNQVVNLYACTSLDCRLHVTPFNLHPRFDYGGRRYGADVFRFIAREFLLIEAPPVQIHRRLTLDHQVDISERTVARMCDDVANLKAHRVDQRTRELLAADPFIVLGLDGQEPGEGGKALWVFIDVLKNRVLYACVVDSMDAEALHRVIEEFRGRLGVHFLGWVSDKEQAIVACHDAYYATIPHQYCQFHFLRNSWKHAEALDSNVFLPLSKVLNALYIHKASKNVTVEFEGVGRKTVREVFAAMDKDFRAMARARNVTFKKLRGIWLYEKLTEYVAGMRGVLAGLDPAYRFTKIFRQTVEDVEAALGSVSVTYADSCLLFRLFQGIRGELADPARPWVEQQVALDDRYREVWTIAKKRGLDVDLGDLRTFQPGKKTSIPEILGEWCRLWESYRPGLFQYAKFPAPVRTSTDCELAFSMEKRRAFARMAKKQVGHVVETRGEVYLRLGHCTREELEEDILVGLTSNLLQRLQASQQDRISLTTASWQTRDRSWAGYVETTSKFYPEWEGFIVGRD
jgi:hypothetical protein